MRQPSRTWITNFREFDARLSEITYHCLGHKSPMPSVDEALRQIREAWSSNADFLDDLKDRLTGAQPIPVVPLIGAGLSMPMGFPSWGHFLKKLAGECGKSSEVATLLAAG